MIVGFPAEHNTFLLATNRTQSVPPRQASDEKLNELKRLFGDSNVWRLNSSSNFAGKALDSTSFSDVQNMLGFSEEKRVTGIIVEIKKGNFEKILFWVRFNSTISTIITLIFIAAVGWGIKIFMD